MSFQLAPLARLPQLTRWGVLLACSGLLSALFEMAGLPAALLLGPLIAAILVETSGGTVRVPRLPHYGAQAVIGCLVARAITPTIIDTFLKEWPLFLGVVLAVVIACSLLGWVISKWGILPGTTAVWGLSPGAASVMLLMADSFGADARLVAFMQYLRVVLVAFAASLIARLWVNTSGAVNIATVWFPTIHWFSFVETLAIVLVGGALGYTSRIPAGALLVPMVIGAILHGTDIVSIQLPPWLLAASYAFLGWRIGLGFTRQILSHAVRVLPQTILSILVIILFCGGLAFILVEALGIDPLTAYLATSPGGMDSVAIIAAASSKVDLSFVMTLQTVRFVVVLMIGPYISRFIASRLGHEVTPTAIDGVSTTHYADIDKNDMLVRAKDDEGELD